MTKILTAAILIGVAFALTGCAGNDAAPVPTSSSTPSATPSMEPLPERAPITNYAGEEGISAFVRYYNELINYAYRTGNTRGLRDSSTSDCVSCARYIKSVEAIYSSGGKVTGSQSSILDLTVVNPQEPTNVRVNTVLAVSETKGIDSSGIVILNEPATDNSKRLWTLARVDNTWRVRSLVRIAA